jgi:hypothetical protein
LDIEPASSHLLVGGIGTGKTTELLAIQRELARAGDFHVVLVKVPSRHVLSDLKPGVLMAIAATEAIKIVEGDLESVPKDVRRAVVAITKVAVGEWTDPDPGDFYDDGDPSVWQRGVLHEPEKEHSVEALEEETALVLSTLKKRLVLLLDGLDRFSNAALFASVVEEDIPAIVGAGMGVVEVGPQHLRFGKNRSIQSRFTSFHLHGAVSLVSDEGTTFLDRVLMARVDPDLLPDETRKELIAWSGGVVRDLVALARAAGEEAYASGADVVEPTHVRAAADRFGRALLLGITQEMAQRLGGFVTRSGRTKELEYTLSSETDIALLLGRLIIEIPGAPVRYVPHPAIVPLVSGLRRTA